MINRKSEWHKNGIHYLQEETIEYYDVADGCEITREEFKNNYIKNETSKNKIYTNTSRHYGYPRVEIKIDTTITARRKPEQLRLF